MNNNVYIYYSGATDKTGKALAEALDISGGIKGPGQSKKVVIGWGAKTKEDVKLGKAIVFNHPNLIKVNRNKLTALQRMAAANVNVAPFIAADQIKAELAKKSSSAVGLPVIARTNYHQGGKNFWTCLTKTHVDEVIDILTNKIKKKGYFQNYVDVKEEFRLHVVNGEIIYAQRKVARTNMKEAHISDQTDKIKAMAEKKGITLDDASLQFALDYQGAKIDSPDLIIKSNTRGYKFANVKLTNVDKALAAEAIKGVEALGLQFGAVDCVKDVDGKAWIIEVNTGPGLDGTAFKTYVAAFHKAVDEILNPVKKAAPVKKTTATAKPQAKTSSTSKLDPDKLRMIADMLDAASDDEKDAVNAVASRMFG
jgi:glutathione synthase/RimK-type ligase-like ATP-grasp enzyme